MNWIKNEYGASIPVYITENGFSDKIGNLDDMQREYYYKHNINQLLKCPFNCLNIHVHFIPYVKYILRISSCETGWLQCQRILCLVVDG